MIISLINCSKKVLSEHTLYVKKHKHRNILIPSLYVNDLIITGNNRELILNSKKKMMQEFEMTDLRLLSYVLGMEVNRSP